MDFRFSKLNWKKECVNGSPYSGLQGGGLHRQAIWALCNLLIKLIPEKQMVLTKILAIHVV